MDKNKFLLGGRLFNTAQPSLGAPTQRKAHPQDGHPNAVQHPSASWVPQGNARHVRKLGTPTQVRNANTRHVRMSASWAPQRNARHVCKLGAPMQVRNANARQVRTSASWAPQRNTRHVRKMVAQTQNSSATKKSTQGSNRLKDELEDG